MPGLTIGRHAMVGAGAVITHSVPDFGLAYGNPARLMGWVCKCSLRLPPAVAGRLTCSCGLIYEEVSPEEIRLQNA
ncbi:MAG: hypothetical protein QM813_02175 [Verrucomicrobiota bacterium]